MILANLSKRNPIEIDGKAYLVKVPQAKELNMVFDTRQQARDYKRFLAQCRRKLESIIVLHEFTEGYELPERTIT